MNGVRRPSLPLTALLLGSGLLLCAPGTAAAGQGGPGWGNNLDADQHGNSGNGRISSTVHITYTQRGGASSGSGGRATVADWDPPGCWYAPEYTPEEFEQWRQRLYYTAVHDPGAGDIVRDISGENQGYAKDEYHKKDEGKGMYWSVQYRDDASLEEMMECDRPPFWADNATPPDVPNAISPEILAGLAYERMKVPSLRAKLAPGAASKVNLPTWVWLDRADVEPVSVTAALDIGGFHMEATTIATPTGMKVEPGTEDARVIPGDGNCPVVDGTIGEPFAPGKADRTPPCGVTYTRSSGEGTYRMSAAVNWETHWTGTGGAGGDLPDGTYGQQQDVRVEEIQAVNR